jgi:hypothetical protein
MTVSSTREDLAGTSGRAVSAADPASGACRDRRYRFAQTRRGAMRALSLPLAADFTLPELRDGQTRLAQLAVGQQLEVREGASLALLADPLHDSPATWRWELLLPVNGPAHAAADQQVGIGRMHGGAYLETVTLGGIADLPRLYAYFLGRLLPARRQQLTRPTIYHRVLAGSDGADRDALTLAVLIPFGLSLRPVSLAPAGQARQSAP